MAQKPLPIPTTPAMNWSDRLSLTEKNLPNLKSLPVPPVGFEPLKATNDELIAAGLPRRPDPEKQPGLYAKWTAVMSRPLTFVPTKFSLITTPRDALLRGLKSAVDQAGPSANPTSSNWSGAVDFGLEAGDSYVTVSGSWTVPNAYPPDSAKLATGGWKDGTYLCVSWVGIDGWGSPDVLQGGTGSECIVSGGKIQSQSAFGWFEWYPYSWTNFSDFCVKPGDSVNCLVCAPGGAGSSTGSVRLGNTSTGQYVSAQLTAPSGTKLVGNCAEWIMEDPSLGGSEAPFPDYGAEFFYDCQAGTAKNVEKNLSGAILLNLVENPPTTLSTAVAESDTILMTYAGNSGP